MGANAARVLVMVAAAALGPGAGGVAKVLPKLPGIGQALRFVTAEGVEVEVEAVQSAAIAKSGITLTLAPGATVASTIGNKTGGSDPGPRPSAAESGLGDLTAAEVKQIQAVVDHAGRPLEVVGSAAKGTRRGIGTELPIGKGHGARSDIDYLVPPGSAPYYQSLEDQLPGVDPKTGIIPGTHNPYMGPAIRFEPGAQPRVVPEASP